MKRYLVFILPVLVAACSSPEGQGFDEYRVPSQSIEEQERIERLQKTAPPENGSRTTV
ncbi:hypothetical protein [Parasulfitobacter algicola]|uniref:Lipoprotein n=1 Tax=Parasulfitobacter algicola TaxID=2614809 RepID=A0ABX2IKU4_9RHOB|nr:hypothetical protein [Sulfitobacter algicola]NSX53190.1 hypothetical protein [Sulfitobacter algicola]